MLEYSFRFQLLLLVLIDRGIANHYKQFGSSPVRYFSVERYYKPLFRLAIWFQKLRELRFR